MTTATITCPKSIKAIALRVTRQDICDQALDPLTPNSRLQTAGFMELSLSPDIEGGEDITTKNGNGDICIRHKDADRLKGFDAELKLCGVPLPVIEMMIGATLLTDGSGNFIGSVLRESKGSEPLNSMAVELWSQNSARDCVVDGGVANFIQWVLPKTTNWEISGNVVFNSGALELTIKGYCENNPNWIPSLPGTTFPSYTPGGGAAGSVPTGAPPTVLPFEMGADTWSLANQAAIRAGGPLGFINVAALPHPLLDCAYLRHSANISEGSA